MSYFPGYGYHYGLPLASSHTFASEKTEKVFEQTTLVVGQQHRFTLTLTERNHTMSWYNDYDYGYGVPFAFSHTFASEKTEKVFEQTTLVVG